MSNQLIKCDKCHKSFSYPLHPMGLHRDIIAKLCFWCYEEWAGKFRDLKLTSLPRNRFDEVWTREFNDWLVGGKERVVFT